jgi:hypothetical protein
MTEMVNNPINTMYTPMNFPMIQNIKSQTKRDD